MIEPSRLLAQIDHIAGDYNKAEVRKALAEMLEGMRDVGSGFLRIAESASIIREKEYYREMGYTSFDQFCKEILGLTRKTVYLYLRIQAAITEYAQVIDSSAVMQLGSAKMDKIIIGINRIEQATGKRSERIRQVKQLMSEIDPTMAVAEVERCVRRHTDGK